MLKNTKKKGDIFISKIRCEFCYRPFKQMENESRCSDCIKYILMCKSCLIVKAEHNLCSCCYLCCKCEKRGKKMSDYDSVMMKSDKANCFKCEINVASHPELTSYINPVNRKLLCGNCYKTYNEKDKEYFQKGAFRSQIIKSVDNMKDLVKLMEIECQVEGIEGEIRAYKTMAQWLSTETETDIPLKEKMFNFISFHLNKNRNARRGGLCILRDELEKGQKRLQKLKNKREKKESKK